MVGQARRASGERKDITTGNNNKHLPDMKEDWMEHEFGT